MKTFIKILLVLVVLAAAMYLFLSSSEPEALVAPARRDLAVDAVSGNLRIFSAKNLYLKCEGDGRVVSTIAPPNSGPMPVEAGQVVVQLDDRDVRRELELAKVKLEAAQSRLDIGSIYDAQIGDAQADLAIQEELAQNEQFATAEMAKTKRLLESLQIQRELGQSHQNEEIAELKAEVSRLETELDGLSIISPFDGYVTDVFTMPGDLVKEGAAVARVISDEKIVEVSLSEEDFAGIELGQTVTARLLAQGSELFNGTVTVLMAEADSKTRRRAVFVELDAPSESLVPGTTGQASVTKAQRENALVIPRRALLGHSVYIVENGTVKLREIQTGFLGLNLAEVTDGLQEGDLVIVETPHLFREGEEVQVVESGQ